MDAQFAAMMGTDPKPPVKFAPSLHEALEQHVNKARKPMGRIEQLMQQVPNDPEVNGRMRPEVAHIRELVEGASDVVLESTREPEIADPMQPLHDALRRLGDQADSMTHMYPEHTEAGKALHGIVSAVREIASVLNADSLTDVLNEHLSST